MRKRLAVPHVRVPADRARCPRVRRRRSAALPRRALRRSRSCTRACSRSRRGSRRRRGTPFFLFAPWPPRWTRFDVVANVLAYAPFGFFVALVPRRRPPPARLSVAIAAGAAMSFAMETLQMFVPPRDANVIDLIANTAGAALGGAVAGRLRALRRREARRPVVSRPLVPPRAHRRSRPRAARDLARRAGESGHPAVRDRVRSVGGVRRHGERARRPADAIDHAAALVEGRAQRVPAARASACSCRCSCASGASSAAPCCC